MWLEPMTCEQARIVYAMGGFVIGMLFTAFMAIRGRDRLRGIREKYQAMGLDV